MSEHQFGRLISSYFVSRETKATRWFSGKSETSSHSNQIWINFSDNFITGNLSIDVWATFKSLSVIKIMDKRKIFMNAVADLVWSDIIAYNSFTCIDTFLTIKNYIYCEVLPSDFEFILKKHMSKPWITPSITSMIKQKSNIIQVYRR